MRSLALIFTSSAVLAGTLLLGSKSRTLAGGLFFVPFALGPLFVTLLMAALLTDRRAQVALLVSSVLYSLWFGYVYADIFYIDVDPQGSVALVFVGLFSLPVMAVFWIAAGVFQVRARRTGQAPG